MGKKGNAENWSYGDALRDQAELRSAVEPEWLVEAQDAFTPTRFKQVIGALERNAAKQGKVIGVVEHKDRHGDVTGYTVSVESKNPRYTGGRKGAGKRKFV